MIKAATPTRLHSSRLLMRPWTPADAPLLEPVLRANVERLTPWLPARVATPAPIKELEDRLAGYAEDFATGKAFRYALLANGEHEGRGALLGGADLHPRAALGRVPLADADRIEIGYWLAAHAEGRGLAAEAVRTLLGIAATLPGLTHVEARINAQNYRSAAVVQRLGFRHEQVDGALDVWRIEFADLLR
jgi:ribosomal-protein-alanine N-acetyltransferase